MSSVKKRLHHRFDQWLKRRVPPSLHKILDNRSIFIFPTRLGFIYLFVMILVFVLGTNYQNNVIILLAYLLASIFITVMLQSYFNFKGLSIIGTAQVVGFANQQFNIPFTLESSKPRQSLNLRFIGQPTTTVDYLENKLSTTVVYTPLRRGEISLERLNIRSQHVLGLFNTWTWCDFGITAIVYPEAKPVSTRTLSKKLETGKVEDGDSGKFIDGNDDFQELNRYRQGEPLSQIAWKQFARGQGKYTKKYHQPVSNDVWLNLDDMPTYDIEVKLSYLCYLVGQYAGQNTNFGLNLKEKIIAPSTGHEHIQSCLYALATYGKQGEL
ncbi:DUF58 domain-containing protein [Thalassotalea atypica]|uniref:DUF58 domain-containing protein n=1 Tax=Thalassotalea atypica TaxID=2054316 RepID=UPI0025725873|nr:DUF58 domain-containing protein [Thalassotalea atypica]